MKTRFYETEHKNIWDKKLDNEESDNWKRLVELLEEVRTAPGKVYEDYLLKKYTKQNECTSSAKWVENQCGYRLLTERIQNNIKTIVTNTKYRFLIDFVIWYMNREKQPLFWNAML